MNRRRAFSLVEILLALSIIGFISASLIQTFGSAQTVSMRQLSLSAKVTTERFTIGGIYTELQRGIKSIEVLSTANALQFIEKLKAEGVKSRDIVIYLADDGRLMRYSTSQGSSSMVGADGIEDIKFSLKEGTDAEDYMLTVELKAASVNRSDENEKRTALREIGLLGVPEKNGTGKFDKAITFVPRFGDIEIFNMRILNEADLSENLSWKSRYKGIGLAASFDIEIPEGATLNIGNTRWFISETETGTYHELNSNGAQQIGSLSVPGDIFKTGSPDVKFTLISSALSVNTSGFVKFIPDVQVIINGETLSAKTAMSPFVDIEGPSSTPSGNLFWEGLKEFAGDEENRWEIPTAGIGEAYKNTKEHHKDDKIKAEVVDDIMRMTISGSGAQSGGGIYKLLSPDHFEEAIEYESKYGEKIDGERVAFTNVTNYSVIFEAQIIQKGIPHSFSLFFNNYVPSMDEVGNNSDVYGYTLEYDLMNSGMPVRLNEGSPFSEEEAGLAQGKNTNADGVKRMEGTPFPHAGADRRMYNPMHLVNSKFAFDNRNSSWYQRVRIMCTVLEYLPKDSKTKTAFIVRAKFIRPLDKFTEQELLTTNYNGDEFFIGKNFFMSEPAWYGDFKGHQYKVAVEGKSKELSYPIRNYDNTMGVYKKSTPDGLSETGFDEPKPGEEDLLKKQFYGVSGTDFQTNFHSKELKISEKFPEEVLKNIKRPRGLGFTFKGRNKAQLTVYRMSIGPGFTPSELKRVLPEGAKLISPRDLYDDIKEEKDFDLNEVLSKLTPVGEDSGVLNVQYPYYKPYYLQDKIK